MLVASGDAAYMVELTSGTMLADAPNPNTPSGGDEFGRCIAGIGEHYLVGAPSEDVSGATGMVYLFQGIVSPTPTPSPTESATPTPSLSPTPSPSPSPTATPSPSLTMTASPTATPAGSFNDVLDYLIGRRMNPEGLDINHDGTVDIADLYAVTNP